jgi:hypothetical protein
MNALQSEFLNNFLVISAARFLEIVQKTCQPDKLGLRDNILLVL